VSSHCVGARDWPVVCGLFLAYLACREGGWGCLAPTLTVSDLMIIMIMGQLASFGLP
jgi:hypothetical protein